MTHCIFRSATRWAAILAVVAHLSVLVRAADSFQPAGNVMRGVYAHLHGVTSDSVWNVSRNSKPQYVADRPHSGAFCLRLDHAPDVAVQGVGQRIELNQSEPRPIKIAGWSRAENVPGAKSYRYALYVDFIFADGTPWHMRTACFETGSHDWQYAETIVQPPKPLRRAEFHAFLRDTAGTAWFDDLFLGEPGGKNLLACPGFERADRRGNDQGTALLADLARLHANALHGYIAAGAALWEEPLAADNALLRFVGAARDRGIGVWLTLGEPSLSVRSAKDADFPQYECVNGPWGQRWTAAVARAARYPFAGLSMVPDEFQWSNGRIKEAAAQHADPDVRAFYAGSGAYCDCPIRRARFAEKYGAEFPSKLARRPSSADAATRAWLRFRYDSTTDWIARTCRAVRAVNPQVRLDSLICVGPICSDLWYGAGVAWDRAGYEAGLEYATTDPYILLHNYMGDSTHWYVTETAEHLAAASPARRCGIVLEGSRLRAEHRELDLVELYGSALSSVWHGASELAWFHHSLIMGQTKTTARPEVSQACIAGVYGLLEKIDPWLAGLKPEPGVALLFSRASCDAWRLWLESKAAERPFDTHGITDPRYASIVQKEALYALLRCGVPTTVYYLDRVRQEELAAHRVIVVPFPLAVSGDQARLLEELARDGKRLVLGPGDGALDENAAPHRQPVLAELRAQGPPVVVLSESPDRLVASRANEKKTHAERIIPNPLDPAVTKAFLSAVSAGERSVPGPLLSNRLPEGDDVEVALAVNARGERLLLAINWDQRPRSVVLPAIPTFASTADEAYRLTSDGRWEAYRGPLRPELRLAGQEAIVARFPKP